MSMGRDTAENVWIAGESYGSILVGFADAANGTMEFTPDQAREFVEAIHFAIIKVEGGNDEDR